MKPYGSSFAFVVMTGRSESLPVIGWEDATSPANGLMPTTEIQLDSTRTFMGTKSANILQHQQKALERKLHTVTQGYKSSPSGRLTKGPITLPIKNGKARLARVFCTRRVFPFREQRPLRYLWQGLELQGENSLYLLVRPGLLIHQGTPFPVPRQFNVRTVQSLQIFLVQLGGLAIQGCLDPAKMTTKIQRQNKRKFSLRVSPGHIVHGMI